MSSLGQLHTKVKTFDYTPLMEFLKLKETVLLLLSCSIASNCATLWTVAHQAPQSMGFSRQKY